MDRIEALPRDVTIKFRDCFHHQIGELVNSAFPQNPADGGIVSHHCKSTDYCFGLLTGQQVEKFGLIHFTASVAPTENRALPTFMGRSA